MACAQKQKRILKVLSDAELVSAIRQLSDEAVFSGEGYRKIWRAPMFMRILILRALKNHEPPSPGHSEGTGKVFRGVYFFCGC